VGQWINEGKGAIKRTRLSCRSFAANAVRLQLHALAYNLGNFPRTLATPEPIKDWSLTTLKEKLIKIGAVVTSLDLRHHDGSEGVGEGKRRGFLVGQVPKLLEGRLLAVLSAARRAPYRPTMPCNSLSMAPFAGVRWEAMRTKCELVWSLMTAALTAMPTAPPTLRIMLKRPLANFSRSGSTPSAAHPQSPA
jgi:Transposase DDE domain group 1